MTRPVVAIDLGDTTVAAVVDVAAPGSALEPVDLDTDLAAVFAPGDDALVSGAEARRRAAADPARYEPAPRRRADDGELLLGTRTVGVAEAWGAVVSEAVARAGALLRGGRPRSLVLTHPFGWDAGRVELLRRAGSGLADELMLLCEPVAAAAYAGWMRPRRPGGSGPVAVLDVGSVAATASVVAEDGEVLGHRRDESFGGADADEMLLAHVLADPASGGRAAARLREVAAGATLADRRHRQVLLDDVRAAKERLSDVEQAEIPLPGGGTAAWLSRGEAEEVLLLPWRAVVALLAGVVAAAGTSAERLDAVWLTGGAARTPQLATLVHRELGVPATVAPDPGTVVARGALVAARARTEREGDSARGAAAGTSAASRGPRLSRSAPPAPSFPSPSPPSGVPVPSGAPVPSGTPTPSGTPKPSYDLAAPFGPDDPLGWDTEADREAGTGADPEPGSEGDPETAPSSGSSTAPSTGSSSGSSSIGRGGAWPAASSRPFDPEHDTVPLPPVTGAASRSRAHTGSRSGSHPGSGAGGDPPTEPGTDDLDEFWLPSPRTSARRRRRRRIVTGAAAAAVVITGAVVVIATSSGDEVPQGTPLQAYAHRILVPPGWTRTGADDAARRTVLHPQGAPQGTALIAVQDNAADRADPDQLREQTRTQYDAARAEGDAVSDLQPAAQLGGRDVVRYRQTVAIGVVVDWVVVLTPGSQVVVGCRYATGATDAGAVRAACEQVVATVGPPGS